MQHWELNRAVYYGLTWRGSRACATQQSNAAGGPKLPAKIGGAPASPCCCSPLASTSVGSWAPAHRKRIQWSPSCISAGTPLGRDQPGARRAQPMLSMHAVPVVRAVMVITEATYAPRHCSSTAKGATSSMRSFGGTPTKAKLRGSVTRPWLSTRSREGSGKCLMFAWQ